MFKYITILIAVFVASPSIAIDKKVFQEITDEFMVKVVHSTEEKTSARPSVGRALVAKDIDAALANMDSLGKFCTNLSSATILDEHIHAVQSCERSKRIKDAGQDDALAHLMVHKTLEKLRAIVERNKKDTPDIAEIERVVRDAYNRSPERFQCIK